MKNLIKILSLAVIVTFLSSCNKEPVVLSHLDGIAKKTYYSNDIFENVAPEIYGAWAFDSSSGGFSGGGYPLDFDVLLIKPNAIFGIVRNDSLIVSGKINIISELDEDLTIEFVAEFDPYSYNINLVTDTKRVGFESNKLNLVSGCCDRYGEHFSRVE